MLGLFAFDAGFLGFDHGPFFGFWYQYGLHRPCFDEVFTGSKWDRRKRKPTPTSKPKMSFGGVLDAFEEMNDVEAVAIFDERARIESIMAEETARRLEQMRKAEIRAAMDAEQVPSRLRKVRLLHGRRERTCACADRWCSVLVCAATHAQSKPPGDQAPGTPDEVP